MGKSKPPRHVAVALVHDPRTKRLLMVSSRAHPDKWIFPKGGIEDGESSGEAAVRESWEEAGTPQRLDPPLDEERLLMLALEEGKSKRPSIWHVHVLETTEEAVNAQTSWPEAHERRRQWMSPAEALQSIRQWYSLPSGSEEVDGVSVGDAAPFKKGDRKGGAMERAISAFMERHGPRI